MNIEETRQDEKLDFSGIPLNYYLLRLLSVLKTAFRLQQIMP